ncbi:hypothetical protein JZ785_21885 [Alicyclobacillus curvatus]|nr:hypothetical protein JZ785_21885 [Alicyclobacillus curvatus]
MVTVSGDGLGDGPGDGLGDGLVTDLVTDLVTGDDGLSNGLQYRSAGIGLPSLRLR